MSHPLELKVRLVRLAATDSRQHALLIVDWDAVDLDNLHALQDATRLSHASCAIHFVVEVHHFTSGANVHPKAGGALAQRHAEDAIVDPCSVTSGRGVPSQIVECLEQLQNDGEICLPYVVL